MRVACSVWWFENYELSKRLSCSTGGESFKSCQKMARDLTGLLSDESDDNAL